MTNLTHILETALLIFAAYLFGCVVGYAVRWALHAGRGTRVVSAEDIAAARAAEAAEQKTRRVMTPAARLARTASNDPAPRRAVAVDEPQTKTGSKRAGPKPEPMRAPRPGGADNLKLIKGIGPKIEASLNELGVYHFDQIASWSKANIAWIDKKLSLRGRIDRERWVAQAIDFISETRASA
jgi:predicted flap endonuclease-1-like 5' DNA nuclease